MGSVSASTVTCEPSVKLPITVLLVIFAEFHSTLILYHSGGAVSALMILEPMTKGDTYRIKI